jgi:hypothetical protein
MYCDNLRLSSPYDCVEGMNGRVEYLFSSLGRKRGRFTLATKLRNPEYLLEESFMKSIVTTKPS